MGNGYCALRRDSRMKPDRRTSGAPRRHFQAFMGIQRTKACGSTSFAFPVQGALLTTFLPVSGFNPNAEEFRSFDQDAHTGLMSSLTLDNDDEPRRGASRANSVRFDEKAINHYGQSSRSSGEILPLRTGSGFGSHPMSERSFSHRSDGRGSSSGVSMRANSFGIEGSRFFNSTTSSPLHPVGPPPALFILSPVPSIIRCWLTTNFSNDSLLYAVVCTGSHVSSVSRSLVDQLQLADYVLEEGESHFLKLAVYLPEGTIQTASSRSNSPAPQVPAMTARFTVYETDPQDTSIQIVIGSDVLRAHNGDILFSQDKLSILDDERNRIAVPLVRPENDNAYKGLVTRSSAIITNPSDPDAMIERTPLREGHRRQSSPGIIGRPSNLAPQHSSPADSSPPRDLPITQATDLQKDHSSGETTEGTAASGSSYTAPSRTSEDRPAGDESSLTTPPRSDAVGGVWNSDWRRTSAGKSDASVRESASGYAKPLRSGRGMKVLKPTKSMANSTRATSGPVPASTNENTPLKLGDAGKSRQASLVDIATQAGSGKPRGANPVGEASAFSWMSKPTARRAD